MELTSYVNLQEEELLLNSHEAFISRDHGKNRNVSKIKQTVTKDGNQNRMLSQGKFMNMEYTSTYVKTEKLHLNREQLSMVQVNWDSKIG